MAPPTRTIHDVVTGDLAERVKQLMLFSRFRVDGRFSGENRSVRKGFSTDFLQHRQYVLGDNLKYIDWRVFGRTGRYVVREYEETTNCDIYVIVDNSASMAYTDGEYSKLEYAQRLCAMIFYMAMKQKDSFGLSLVGENLRMHAAPGTSRRHLIRMYEALLTQEPSGTCDWESVLRLVQAKVKRRGLVLIVSDFMADPEGISRGLSGFRSQNCDVITFHLQHPREMDLDQTSMTRFVDMEDGTAETVDPLLVRDAYKEQVAKHSTALRQAFNHRGVAYCPLIVGPDYDVGIGDFLRHRMNALL